LHDEAAVDDSSAATEQADACPLVPLKFMKNRDQFDREVGIRAKCRFSNSYVLDCLRRYDGDSLLARDAGFREDAILKGYEEYPYCVVMDAGSMNLKRLVDNQNVAGNDWDAMRIFTKQIAQAVLHIHQRGVIHGDLKGTVRSIFIILFLLYFIIFSFRFHYKYNINIILFIY